MVVQGAYGTVNRQWIRGVWMEDTLAGLIVGAQVAPAFGFILQVAVAPERQGQGIGTRLIRELAERLRADGFVHIGLGVTCANPARRLYQRLGFQTRKPVRAYVWRRSGASHSPKTA